MGSHSYNQEDDIGPDWPIYERRSVSGQLTCLVLCLISAGVTVYAIGWVVLQVWGW